MGQGWVIFKTVQTWYKLIVFSYTLLQQETSLKKRQKKRRKAESRKHQHKKNNNNAYLVHYENVPSYYRDNLYFWLITEPTLDRAIILPLSLFSALYICIESYFIHALSGLLRLHKIIGRDKRSNSIRKLLREFYEKFSESVNEFNKSHYQYQNETEEGTRSTLNETCIKCVVSETSVEDRGKVWRKNLWESLEFLKMRFQSTTTL